MIRTLTVTFTLGSRELAEIAQMPQEEDADRPMPDTRQVLQFWNQITQNNDRLDYDALGEFLDKIKEIWRQIGPLERLALVSDGE